jgi:hypothetical protein
MSRFKVTAATLAAATALLFAGSASALTWYETGAGDTLASAEAVTGAFDAISGFLDVSTPVNGTPEIEVDLYQISINSYASFSASTTAGDDTALFLFDATGAGVYTNDDNGFDLLSTLPAGNAAGPTANGIYYLAVAVGGFLALDSLSNSLFAPGSFTDVLAGVPGVGPLAAWAPQFPFLSESGMGYQVVLTGVGAVPEPSTVLLMCAGGIALWARQRRQRGEPQRG